MLGELESKDSRCKDGWLHDFSSWSPSLYYESKELRVFEARQCLRCGTFQERMVTDDADESEMFEV